MSVSALIDNRLTAVETLDASGEVVVSNPDQVHSLTAGGAYGGGPRTLDATTTPPATKAHSKEYTLTAGALVLDLTALVRGGDFGNVDFTGLRLRALKIVTPNSNTAGLVVTQGDTNPYPVFVNASGLDEIPIDAETQKLFKSGAAVVGATVKNIKFTSTHLTAKFKIIMIAG